MCCYLAIGWMNLVATAIWRLNYYQEKVTQWSRRRGDAVVLDWRWSACVGAWWSIPTSSSQNCFFVASLCDGGHLGICRPTDRSWTCIKPSIHDETYYLDIEISSNMRNGYRFSTSVIGYCLWAGPVANSSPRQVMPRIIIRMEINTLKKTVSIMHLTIFVSNHHWADTNLGCFP